MKLLHHKWMTVVLAISAPPLVLISGGCAEASPSMTAAQVQPSAHEHEGEDGHGGGAAHAEHEGQAHQGHEGEKVVNLSPREIKEFGVEVRSAEPGTVKLTRTLPGEVVLNPTGVAHVVPRVPGVVREVRVGVGDHVEEGEVMAVLISRELARAKSEYLAALTRLDLAKADFQRARKLWQQNITSEAEYLQAKQALAEARLDVRLAKRELQALGLSKKELERLKDQPHQSLARYELTGPISGEVIERHLTEGEVAHRDPTHPPFVIADMSNVWVKLTVYPDDLAAIQPGQKVVVTTKDARLKATGTIAYVSPTVEEATRTATARVVLENPEGKWKPGLFVTGRVITGTPSSQVVVPKSALQTLDGEKVVFVKTREGFKPQPVEVGRSNGQRVQIVSGLKPGQRYAAANAFILKAALLEGTFSGHHH